MAARAAMRDAIADLNRAHDAALAALAAVDTVADRQAAFELADQLASRIEELGKQDDAVRRGFIHRIWTVDELSLRQLATQVGLSKTRAEQLVRTFRSSSPNPEGAPQCPST